MLKSVRQSVALALAYDATGVYAWSRAVFTARSNEWVQCGLTRSGARIECRRHGKKSTRWRLSGYADNGADVEVLEKECVCGDKFFVTKLEGHSKCYECRYDSEHPIYGSYDMELEKEYFNQ